MNEEIRKWVYEELEPYFQGEFGTMDTMLEMFIEQLTDKLVPLLADATKKGAEEVRKLVIDDIMAALAKKVNKTPLKMKKDVGIKEAPYYWNGYNDGLKDSVWFIDAKFNGNEKVMPCKCECHKEKEGVYTVGTESVKIVSSYCSNCIDKHSVNKTI